MIHSEILFRLVVFQKFFWNIDFDKEISKVFEGRTADVIANIIFDKINFF